MGLILYRYRAVEFIKSAYKIYKIQQKYKKDRKKSNNLIIS